MPTAIDAMRRRTLLAFGAVAPLAGFASTPARRLAAAWDGPGGSRVGVLSATAQGWRTAAPLEVPTRAHGLLALPGGALLAVARRPGDWLLRFDAASARAVAWHWIEADRRFTGHAVLDLARGRLYTGETDLDSGAGLVGVRDARTLARLGEWPAHGIDPHELLLDGAALYVANGGVPALPDSGRAKRDLERMDSSLVRLALDGGRLLGQWRLADARLSLRHLARRGDGGIGIALQAEHDAAEVRQRAPLLALFDGRALRACSHDAALAGYGGDIAASRDGWAVSAPRAGVVACWSAGGAWRGGVALAAACALAAHRGAVLAGGSEAVAEIGDAGEPLRRALPPSIRLDNHWLGL